MRLSEVQLKLETDNSQKELHRGQYATLITNFMIASRPEHNTRPMHLL